MTSIQRIAGMTRQRAAARRALALAALALPMLLGACNVDDILAVNDPDIVTPENLSGPAGLATLRAGALGDFALALSGSAAGHGSTPGLIHFTAAFTDEVTYAGTFPTRREVDERRILERNSEMTNVYRNLHRARAAAENAAARLETVGADPAQDPRIAEMRSIAGYTYLAFGENYCSGVPISTARENGQLDFGEPQTTVALLETALARFDAALTNTAGDDQQEWLARVGRGRALLNLGRFADAATAVAPVPTNFVYRVEYSSNSLRQQNGVFQLTGVDRQFSVGEAEGGNGLAYRSTADPRVPWKRTEGEVGQDGSTPFYLQQKYPNPSAPTPLATGVEARLIEAEAALQANDVARFAQIHTQLRGTVGLGPMAVAGLSRGALVDAHFRERAFWQWLTAQRLADLRRLVRQYSRTAESVFPSGPYFKGGSFGPDVNFPIPIEEQNNPNYKGCLDRNA